MQYNQEDAVIMMFYTKTISNSKTLRSAINNILGISKFTNLIIISECNDFLDKKINELISKRIFKFKRNIVNSSICFLSDQKHKKN